MDLSYYTIGLVDREGIFFAKQSTPVSYPESGNQLCFQLEDNSFWFRHRNHCIVEAVKKYSPNEHLFDIGGGNGFVSIGLEKEGISTVLIEPGIQGCMNAKKRMLKNIVCSTLENAEFKKGTIPSMGLFDVVEHIENDVDFLTMAHSYLINNGFIYITVPAYEALWSNEDIDAGHYRRYTLAQLENKLKNIGFTIEYSTYIFSVLPLPVLLFRTIPSLLGFNKKSKDENKHKNEHKDKKGLINIILNKLWKFEQTAIKKGTRIPLGGSCFVVAKKTK